MSEYKPAKRYTVDDFRTTYARNKVEELLREVDWDVIEKYAGTDAWSKIGGASLKKFDKKSSQFQSIAEAVPYGDGQFVPVEDANKLAKSTDIMQVDFLYTLESYFDGRKRLPLLNKKFKQDIKGVMTPQSFGMAFMVMTEEGIHIYLETLFSKYIQYGPAYLKFRRYIDQEMSASGTREECCETPLLDKKDAELIFIKFLPEIKNRLSSFVLRLPKPGQENKSVLN